ncbi:pyridoxamine 5'-phosphate oxidase family protein [Oceanobacter mangrovi]|uniref:pyridoxamine 5'-phosphate oxidase family protein n=1 Tax=Oceanobacter mangrovi TaxID=2862510 RepID=UPI001C8F077B|nr:pyridoxamine 5'-phosphate oxidase family protein [Oceanobacter mangrovi]
MNQTSHPAQQPEQSPSKISLQSPLSTVKRGAKRAAYDQQTVHQIIDESLICHIAQQQNGKLFVTPTCHWRDGEYLYWHGHSRARNVHDSAADDQREGQQVCINLCLLDGLVLARSAFHHSVNYRSVTLFGVPEWIEDADEKARQLKNMVDKISPQRWQQLRPMTDTELKATGVVRVRIDQASAKVRNGDPIDDEADLDWPVLAGVLPLQRQWGELEIAADFQLDAAAPELARPLAPAAF